MGKGIEEIKELETIDRLNMMTLTDIGLFSYTCEYNHVPIVYEGDLCPMCMLQDHIDEKDKEMLQLVDSNERLEDKFNDMESEKDDLQVEKEALDDEIYKLEDRVEYLESHCPEAAI